MKSYDELTSELLERKKEYDVKKQKRVKKIVSLSSALCLILIVGLLVQPITSLLKPTNNNNNNNNGSNNMIVVPAGTDEPTKLPQNGETPQGGGVNPADTTSTQTGETTQGGGNTNTSSPENYDAKNYEELYEYLQENLKNLRIYSYLEKNLDGVTTAVTNDATADGGASDSRNTPDYSDTNIQVEGVQEADVIKTDGNYIYMISNGCVYIAEAKNGRFTLLSRIDRRETYPEDDMFFAGNGFFEMYVTSDRLAAIKYDYEKTEQDGAKSEITGYYARYATRRIETAIYDITDKNEPKLINSYYFDGYYRSSRMIGDTLYMVTEKTLYKDVINKDVPSTYLPQIADNSAKTLLSASDIYFSKNKNEEFCADYLIIASVDVSGMTSLVSVKALFGYSTEIYANTTSIYAAASRGSYENDKKTVYSNSTDLFRFSIKDGEISLEAQGAVFGIILNQFSMDEYNGYFRIVTTVNRYFYERQDSYRTFKDEQYNCLYILDKTLKITGSIEKLAEDERIYSVRFDKDIAYFVTFRQTDPLFAADVSDPENPKILSALKIPGFSNYLHVYGQGLLFGLGRNADESGRADFMKLSMFDTSNPADVSEKHTLVIENTSYSSAQYNHKAILINPQKNIIAFPAQSYVYSDSHSSSRYYVYSYDAEKGFVKQAEIPLDKLIVTDSASNRAYYYSDMRGLYIGNYLYVFSPEKGVIASFDMTTYEIYNFMELEPVG